jgi:hypothetical protein
VGYVKRLTLSLVAICCFGGCNRQPQVLLPLHIEAPEYDNLAIAADIQGDVELTVKIDSDGSVLGSTASGPPVLVKAAQQNIAVWRFERPRHGPINQNITYKFVLEEPGGCSPSPELKTDFELPYEVTIVAQATTTCDPAETITRKH